MHMGTSPATPDDMITETVFRLDLDKLEKCSGGAVMFRPKRIPLTFSNYGIMKQ